MTYDMLIVASHDITNKFQVKNLEEEDKFPLTDRRFSLIQLALMHGQDDSCLPDVFLVIMEGGDHSISVQPHLKSDLLRILPNLVHM